MKSFYVLAPGNISQRLESMILATVGSHHNMALIKNTGDLPDLKNQNIICAIELNEVGFNVPFLQMLLEVRKRGTDALAGSTGAVLINSPSELFTKSASNYVIFLANQMGCRFPGHPMVEATENLHNFLTWQKTLDLPLEKICIEQCKRLGKRLQEDEPLLIENPNIIVLHASSRRTSNTLNLWDMASKYLCHCHIKELHVENGTVRDCKGCSYRLCKHYSEQNSCFYGGFMVEEIMPSIEEADAVVWLCPNYNDAVTANLTAVINRLTALYIRMDFYSKTVFSVIVSGNSGSDSVARQLIDALNINKGFRLPPYFTVMATANDAGAILKVPDIERHAKKFAENILHEIKR